jgi:hypothetical protein
MTWMATECTVSDCHTIQKVVHTGREVAVGTESLHERGLSEDFWRSHKNIGRLRRSSSVQPSGH